MPADSHVGHTSRSTKDLFTNGRLGFDSGRADGEPTFVITKHPFSKGAYVHRFCRHTRAAQE